MVLQGHDKALEKLSSRVAAMVPEEQFREALEAAGLRASNSRFVNFAELAAIEALQVLACYLPLNTCLSCILRKMHILVSKLAVQTRHGSRLACAAGCRMGAGERSRASSHRRGDRIRAELHNGSGRGWRACHTGLRPKVSISCLSLLCHHHNLVQTNVGHAPTGTIFAAGACPQQRSDMAIRCASSNRCNKDIH